MHPILLHSPRVTSYGAAVLVALLIGWCWTRRRARGAGVDPAHIDVMGPLLVACGLGGAWVMGAPLGEGRVLWGGLIGGVAAAIGYCVWKGLKIGVVGDAFAPAIALAIGVGRIGCLMAGCCWGKVCRDSAFALRFPPGSFAYERQAMAGWVTSPARESLPVYPVQIIEAAAAFVLAAVLARGLPRPHVPGETFLSLGIGYSVVRFSTEFLRGDNVPLGGLTPSQWLCIAVSAACIVTWSVRRARGQIRFGSSLST